MKALSFSLLDMAYQVYAASDFTFSGLGVTVFPGLVLPIATQLRQSLPAPFPVRSGVSCVLPPLHSTFALFFIVLSLLVRPFPK